MKYNWFTWYLLSYLGHQWSCLGQESPFGENVNCEFKFVDKNLIFYVFFFFFASFGNLCPSRSFSISLIIFIGLKLFIIFPYCSLTSIQYLMSHLFLILVFYVFSFFHSVSLVKSISFDWALQKKKLWFSLILFIFCFIYFCFVLFPLPVSFTIFLLFRAYFLFFSLLINVKVYIIHLRTFLFSTISI